MLFIVIYIFYNVNYAMTWAMMDEGAIPAKYSGTAAGVISTVGYLPEVFCSLLAGALIDGNPGVSGFRQYFFWIPDRDAALRRSLRMRLDQVFEKNKERGN